MPDLPLLLLSIGDTWQSSYIHDIDQRHRVPGESLFGTHSDPSLSLTAKAGDLMKAGCREDVIHVKSDERRGTYSHDHRPSSFVDIKVWGPGPGRIHCQYIGIGKNAIVISHWARDPACLRRHLNYPRGGRCCPPLLASKARALADERTTTTTWDHPATLGSKAYSLTAVATANLAVGVPHGNLMLWLYLMDVRGIRPRRLIDLHDRGTAAHGPRDLTG